MARKCRLKTCREPLPKATHGTIYQNAGYCCVECLADHERAKRLNRALKKKSKPKRDRSGDLSHQIELTQSVFNRFIRTLDSGKPCISCGRSVCGGVWDAGHFRSVGSCPELRFDPRNCYLQGSGCNRANRRPDKNNSRNAETIAAEYDSRLRDLMGGELVDWIKGPHPASHWTIDELKKMRSMLSAETRRIEKGESTTRDWRALGFDWRELL